MTNFIRDHVGHSVECPSCGNVFSISQYDSEYTIRSPSDVQAHNTDMGFLEREELRVVILDTRNHVRKTETVYMGSVSVALVRVGELFKEAVKMNASAIILVHNHPSGDATPSPDDLHLTAEVIAAGKILSINLLDHIVISSNGFSSLRDRGINFER